MPSKTSTALTVLLVDDDELTRLHLNAALSKQGMQITEACNGPLALRLAEETDFDIVLMDVNMPVMDGFETCKAFKELPNHSDTPIIMVTGMDDLESIQKATDVGATDYVTKPVSAAILSKRMQQIVEAHRNTIELANQKASQSALLHALPDTILRFSAEGILVGSKFSSASPDQLQKQAVSGNHIDEIFENAASAPPKLALLQALNGNTPVVQMTWTEGQERICEARFVASTPEEITCVLHDVTQQVHQQQYIQSLAITDPLTGLPNQARLLQLAQRNFDNTTTTWTMLQLHFETFNAIKNSVGASMADKIIAHIAGRLKENILNSTSDSEERPVVARTGESSFHILLPGAVDSFALKRLTTLITIEFDQPIRFGKYEFRLPFRSGAACLSSTEGGVDDLYQMSGLASHRACSLHATETVLYTPKFEQETHRSLTLESALHKAISNNELKVVYQPKVCSISGALKGTEALLRWEHPKLGHVSPGEFIPLAEETGLILPIGDFVLEQACKQSHQWQQQGLKCIPIAVNISGHQLNQRNVVTRLLKLLKNYNLPPEAIELEITESVLVDQTHILGLLAEIRGHGLKIAIDDFGTGYSSLSMLKNFPVDVLKIDRSFVMEIVDATSVCGIADAVVALGHALNLTMVAEGIETEEQLNYFKERKCHLIQGYLTGRPMAPDDVVKQFF